MMNKKSSIMTILAALCWLAPVHAGPIERAALRAQLERKKQEDMAAQAALDIKNICDQNFVSVTKQVSLGLVNPNLLVSFEDQGLQFPLIAIAVIYNTTNLIEAILRCPTANPNKAIQAIPGKSFSSNLYRPGMTALHLAVRDLNLALGELLISCSKPVLLQPDCDGNTPTHLLAESAKDHPEDTARFYEEILGPIDFSQSYTLKNKYHRTPQSWLIMHCGDKDAKEHPLQKAWNEHAKEIKARSSANKPTLHVDTLDLPRQSSHISNTSVLTPSSLAARMLYLRYSSSDSFGDKLKPQSSIPDNRIRTWLDSVAPQSTHSSPENQPARPPGILRSSLLFEQ